MPPKAERGWAKSKHQSGVRLLPLISLAERGTPPNAIPGAPLVPANQKVTLNLTSSHAFEYVAETENAKSAKWQIMMHHGAAYSLSGIWRGELAHSLSPGSPEGISLHRLRPPSGRFMGVHVLEPKVGDRN